MPVPSVRSILLPTATVSTPFLSEPLLQTAIWSARLQLSQRALGKAGSGVHGDKVAALGRVPARNAERLDLTLERFDDHVELRLHDLGVLLH